MHDLTVPPVGPGRDRLRSPVQPLGQRWLASATELHLRSFQGYMNTKLGYAYVVRFMRWHAETPEALGFVAVSGDRCVGYVVGSPLECESSFRRAMAPSAARAFLRRPWLLLEPRILKAVRANLAAILGRAHHGPGALELPKPTMGLVGIAVDPGAQGQGIGSLLMDEFTSQAMRREMRSMLLTVYAANESARQFYLRHGWTPSPGSESSSTITFTKVL